MGSLMFGPLGVVADCIPCIGPMLGDSIETITCCISCLPATACCSLIVGIVWVGMRPQLGVPLLLVFVACIAGFACFKARASQGKSFVPAEPHYYGAAQMQTPEVAALLPTNTPVQPVGLSPAVIAAPATVAAEQVQPVRRMSVQVPEGCGPGSTIQVTSPAGALMTVTVPEGCVVGSVFIASY